jgi:predicted transcriptional regulator
LYPLFKKRSHIEILYEVINAARGHPCLKTTLLRKSELSHWLMTKYLDFALSQQLLEQRIFDQVKLYLVTDKGFRFLKAYEELQDLFVFDKTKTNVLVETL